MGHLGWRDHRSRLQKERFLSAFHTVFGNCVPYQRRHLACNYKECGLEGCATMKSLRRNWIMMNLLTVQTKMCYVRGFGVKLEMEENISIRFFVDTSDA